MDIREFSNKIAEATKNMSDEERNSLMKMFETVADDISRYTSSSQGSSRQDAEIALSTIHPSPRRLRRWMRMEFLGTYRETGEAEGELPEAGSVHHHLQSKGGNEDNKGKSGNA